MKNLFEEGSEAWQSAFLGMSKLRRPRKLTEKELKTARKEAEKRRKKKA